MTTVTIKIGSPSPSRPPSPRKKSAQAVAPAAAVAPAEKAPPTKDTPKKPMRIVTPNIVIPDHVLKNKKLNPNAKYKNNQIYTSKYTWITFLPKNLFEQFYRFANLYFLSIQILNWLPGMEVFIKEVQLMPLLFVLSVTAIKDLFEDRRRHLSDKRVNNLNTRVYDNKLKQFRQVKWQEILVGDLIQLSNNEIVPADVLLLKCKSAESDEEGTCYVETANLDGENNLKHRYAVPNFGDPDQDLENYDFDFVVECEKPNLKLHKFQGRLVYHDESKPKIPINQDNLLLRDCKLKNTSYAIGLVIYAGHETKAMLNNKGPRLKRSKLEKMMNRDIIMCVIILIIMCIMCFMGRYLWLNQFVDIKNMSIPYTIEANPVEALDFPWPLRTVCTFAILYQMIIPISLYVCIEMVKLGQVYIINRNDDLYDKDLNKRCECRAWNITEDLGQIEYMFCDKTGTLTENVMKFRCCSINGVSYEHESPESSQKKKDSGPGHSSTDIKVNPELKQKVDEIAQKYQKWFDSENKKEDDHDRDPKSDSDDHDHDHDHDGKPRSKPKTGSERKPPLKLSFEQQVIHDFFIVLTICNTANSPVMNQDTLDPRGKRVSATDKSSKSNKFSQRFATVTSSSVAGEQQRKESSKRNSFDFMDIFLPHSVKQSESSKRGKREQQDKQKEGTLGRPTTPRYESESPDEVALVSAAYQYKYRLIKRTRDSVIIQLPNGSVIRYKVLALFPFDSDRKRMSIIVNCPFTYQIIMYCKGSDQNVFEKLLPNPNDQHDTAQKHLRDYSEQGLRVLCMAKRILDPDEYLDIHGKLQKAEASVKRDKQLKRLYNKSECYLRLLGATAIEDKLQDRVPEVIAKLRKAGITVWVLTGDKMETAISIAKACSLFSADMKLLTISLATVKSKRTAKEDLNTKLEIIKSETSVHQQQSSQLTDVLPELVRKTSCKKLMRQIYLFLNRDSDHRQPSEEGADPKSDLKHPYGLVIDSQSLNFVVQKDNIKQFMELTRFCASVLCCRTTPSQKAYVVKCVKNKLNALTASVGDGANDVAMIQTAHIGIGIIGLEGTQAAMASDFAIPKFHYLENLILVHGNLCYNRLALTILYFFYKNTLVVFVLFFYQFHCGFSGQSLLDDIYLMLVNILYTTMPAIIRGILEKECDESIFLQYPQLYERGRKSRVYTYRSFWVCLCDSVYQSAAIFYMCYWIFQGSNIGIHEFGLAAFFIIVETTLLQICMENRYWNPYFTYSVFISIGFFLSSILFLDFNYSKMIITILGGRNYKIFFNLVFHFEFIKAILVVPVACLLPRFTIRALQEIIKPQFKIPNTPPMEKKNVKN